MLGSFAYLIELWGPPPMAEVDRNGDGRMDEEEQQAWIDTELTGEGWIVPHRVKHPVRTESKFGGTDTKRLTIKVSGT